MEFKYIIILVCFAFASFLLFKEIRREDKSRLIWRLLTSILMVASFALLIIPLTYSVKKEAPAHEINLLTEGTVLDSISNKKGNLYGLDSSLFPERKNLKVNHLADLSYYLRMHSEIRKINIYGYGLDESQLKILKDHQVVFHPSIAPAGIVSANWPKRLKVSEKLKVQGIYNNQTSKTVKLKLYGLGSSLDSIDVKANSKIHFSFSDLPKQTGKAVFSLIALQEGDTLSVEPIPFKVENKKPVSLLILASFPDFEYKFLKKWLYENQYPIAFRSQISKNKYNTDFLNRKAVNLNRIHSDLLKNIDLVIIDEDELAAISNAERSALYNSVNSGMGLIIRITNSKPSATAQKFNRYEVSSTLEKPSFLKSAENLKFSSLPFTQTLFIKSTTNDQPLITDEAGKIVVNSQISGMGKILTSTISSTYQWQLAGHKVDYARFWSALFAKSLRKKIETQSLEILPQFPSIEEKSRLIVHLPDGKPPVVSIDNTSISPRQNMELPFEWDGFFWPRKVGWQAIVINQNAEDIYIYKKEDWTGVKLAQRLAKTENFVKNQLPEDSKSDQIKYSNEEEISKWWFFAGFLITSSYLWYESRVLANK